jgi:hypothetical protein
MALAPACLGAHILDPSGATASCAFQQSFARALAQGSSRAAALINTVESSVAVQPSSL